MRTRWLYVTNLIQQDKLYLPTLEYSEDWSLNYEVITVRSSETHGSYDIFGVSDDPIMERDITINAIVDGNTPSEVENKIKDLTQRTTGMRMLWRGYPDETNLKWTFARLSSLTLGRGRADYLTQPVTIVFRQPDPFLYQPADATWLSGSGYTVATLDPDVFPDRLYGFNSAAKFTVATSPYTFNLENIGTVTSRRLIFYIKVTGSNGAENVQITNKSMNSSFSLNDTGTSSSYSYVINTNPGVSRGIRSTDSEITWQAFNVSIGPLQAVIMELAPGVNEFELTTSSTPSLELYVWWQHAFLW